MLWQTASRELPMAAERNGFMMLAEIADAPGARPCHSHRRCVGNLPYFDCIEC
jgi:hypothetical protein